MSTAATFQGILNFRMDEDGNWIVTDNRTIVYGDGETETRALKDYIVSLHEYTGLLLMATARGKRQDSG